MIDQPPLPSLENNEESKFRRLIEDANASIATWTPDGVITYLSPGFQRIFGLNPEDWTGQSFPPLVHPDDLDACLIFNQSAIDNNEPRSGLEFRHIHQQGHWVWSSVSVAPITDDTGQVIALHGVIRDINDRKQQELALQAYAERQTLLNQLVKQIRNSLDIDAVIANAVSLIRDYLEIDTCRFSWYEIDPESGGGLWNVTHAACVEGMPTALGLYPVDQVGFGAELFDHQKALVVDDVAVIEDPTHRALLKMLKAQAEMLLPIRTSYDQMGLIVCIHTQARPWQAAEVELVQAVGDQLAIAIDQAALYAESQASSRELQVALQELKQTQSQIVQSEKMSSLGQLVAGIAHEINNPVNFIHGNIQHSLDYTQGLMELLQLYRSTYSEPTAAIAEKIEAIDLEFLCEDLPKSMASMQMGTERIREIVKSLRLFSRLDEAEFKPVDIHEGIDSTLMILQSRIKGRPDRDGIQIVKEYGELPEVECFAGQLNQVFMNVLSNAIDALEDQVAVSDNNSSPSIVIKTAITANNQVSIHFIDNGSGISPEVQAQMFNPFFTTKAVGKGTGMGMAISYQIITEKHGGQILCHSTLGQGTEMVIQIPCHHSDRL